MIRCKLLLLFLFLICTHAFAQSLGSLHGSISDQNGKPLSGATILLEPDRHLTQTDKQGKFLFKDLYKGSYQVKVTMVGFKTFTGKAVIDEGKAAALAIILETGESELEEVEVSGSFEAADNLLKSKRSAMPVTIITRRTIELMGSRRLDEVLKEQTGIAIVNNIGGGARAVGVQIQGFGSEYVMVLIDGQPMTGRNSGNFDLSRISVSNIERIEIIKGASSCLFGSEALGGAINIITRHGAIQQQALASINYGSLNIADATLEAETPFAAQRGSVNLSANYYRSDGFNTNPKYIQSGTTSPPYDNYALQGRSRYRLSKTSTVGLSGRYALRQSFMPKDFGLGNISGDRQDETDLNLSATFDHNFESGLRSMSRYYLTTYSSDMSVAWQGSGSQVSNEVFTQTLHRFEQQFAYAFSNGIKVTSGLGGSLENMNDDALTDAGTLSNAFGYLQGDWGITKKLEAVGGLRYDHTNNYGGKLNPSFGLQYHIRPNLTLKAGAGTGFKTPDFKTRYLVFYNPTANYLVVGNDVLRETLDQLQQQGQISEIRQYLLNQLDQNLQAERSTSLNAGFVWKPRQTVKIEGGVFYHDLRNQINSIQIATGTNNRVIYTYQNLPKAVNKGIDASVVINPLKDLEISGGYQYLIAKDRSVEDSIRKGNWPYGQNIHDPATGNSYAPKPSDYWGIENRSRHMINLRAFYVYRPWDISINARVNYRGKYPFGDRNGNNFIDRYDTFVDGYFLINAAVEKKLMNQHLSIRLTADNLADYIDPLMPGQPGRILLAGLTYRFYKD
ncbi:TonB-dependent receptor [Pedobacter metabolipauper]|uniref:Outer membrane receptor for ferrienterochelin and colicins n=1 Tax=Pedobacter metabolipauper TaxID=425513 RepID=A0A4R6SWK7_9SPHI|nr:TonB-dependent receptor [Pedobacter metabolipauper]TDQ09779.1 outer membrane receptor for ferrienterochelin and colicins [Pedobacter metabolipauper]